MHTPLVEFYQNLRVGSDLHVTLVDGHRGLQVPREGYMS